MSYLKNIMNGARGLRVAELAMANIDAPYQTMGRDPLTGLDHIGHIMAVYRGLTGVSAPEPKEYVIGWEARGKNEWLTNWLLSFCDVVPVQDAAVGDIIAFRMKDGATINHCAVRVSKSTICAPYWGRACVESFYEPYWHKHAVMAFRFKAVEAANSAAVLPALEAVA